MTFAVYLLVISVIIGLIYGGAVLVFDDNKYALYTFKYVYPSFVLFALALAIVNSRPIE